MYRPDVRKSEKNQRTIPRAESMRSAPSFGRACRLWSLTEKVFAGVLERKIASDERLSRSKNVPFGRQPKSSEINEKISRKERKINLKH